MLFSQGGMEALFHQGSMERSLSEDLDLVNVQIEEYWAEEWMELILPVYHKGKSWSKIV